MVERRSTEVVAMPQLDIGFPLVSRAHSVHRPPASATTSTKDGIEQTTAKGTTVQVGQVSKVGRSNKTTIGEHEHEREDELKIGMGDDAFCDSIVNDHDFDYGAKHALQEALRNAKTNGDKLRAVSAYVGSEGATGLEAMGAQEVPWDVELEGDKNFPGEAGRLAMEQKIAGYQGAIEGKPGAAAGIVGNVQADLDGLRARRAAVADVKMYSDLPNPMRQTELQKIDRLIERVSSLRHMAAIDACKNDPAADLAHPAAETHEHATPEQKKLAALRGDIGKVDGQILAMQKKIDGNRAAQKGVRIAC
jgi:hypothetical protein